MDKLVKGAQALGITLTLTQQDMYERYYRALVDWNQRVNLTSITDYEEVQVKHFLDSLSVVTVTDFSRGLDIIDIGTGAGFPGIPLKIVFPDIKLTLLEATIKKTKFLEAIVNELGLKNVEIIAERAETAAHDKKYREKFDVVLSRAVAPLPALAELCLPFCKIGGVLIAQKKGDIETETKQAQKVITLLGGTLQEKKPVALDGLKDGRYLLVIKKIGYTPPQYPRRPGMPGKRPLTG